MENLRKGFTTGSCAAAASKAAAYMLFMGGVIDKISIETPKGITFDAEILNIEKKRDSVRCGVEKDGGDDPDVTTGLIIYAQVSRCDEPGVHIRGGKGVGIVTKPGLDQPVGNHAINSVPREMIKKEIEEVLSALDEDFGVEVTISAPGGEEIALKTFNPRLGIEGGISIIGTSGIVEPMSTEAIIETIRVELRQKKAEGYDIVSISPGNYGLDFMEREYGFDLDRSVKCSNFIGVTCDMVRELEFKKMLFVGHAGKLVKVGAGIMNTHSKEGDGRMEAISEAASKEGADQGIIDAVMKSNTTDEAFVLLQEKGLLEKVGKRVANQIVYHLKERTGGDIEIESIMFSNVLGVLGVSDGATALVDEIKKEYSNLE